MMKTAREKISIALLIILSPIVVWSFLTLKTHSLYHPESTSYADPWTGIPNIALKKKIQNIYFTTVDKVRINGWYVPPQPGKPSIVFAHGNGGNQGDRFDVLQAFVEQGYGFFSFDYRGYGKSRGTPSEAGLYHDLEAASLYLQQHGIPIKNQIAMGESLGSGVAVALAADEPGAHQVAGVAPVDGGTGRTDRLSP